MIALSPSVMAAGQGKPMLCALSGGGDSVALLMLLKAYADANAVPLYAAHVHHHLRGEEADGDAAYCQTLCARLEIPLTVLHVQVPHGAAEEENARKLRYEALTSHAQSLNAHLYTAHNADDALETLLFHLCRGASPGGLGIPPVRPLSGELLLLRPLLEVPGSDLREYLDAQGIEYREDRTNADPAYTRNRLRMQVLPLLREIHPRAAVHTAHTLALLAEDEAYFAAQVAARLAPYPEENGCRKLPCSVFDGPPSIASRMVKALHRHPDLTAAHIEAVCAMAKRSVGSEALSLPGMQVRREYDAMIFRRMNVSPLSETETAPEDIPVTVPGTYFLPGWAVTVAPAEKGRVFRHNFHNIFVDSRKIRGILYLRTRRSGDRFTPYKGNGSVTLKKRCIDRKIPAGERDLLPVLADEAGIVACALLGLDVRAAADENFPADGEIWEINFAQITESHRMEHRNL